MRNTGKHAYNLAVLGPPGQRRQCLGFRVEQQIGMRLAPEAGDCGSVEGDAVFKCARKLRRVN